MLPMANWAIIGQAECEWCEKAWDKLENDLGHYANYYDASEIKDLLAMAGLTTVPQVFHNGKHIGGYEDLERYLDQLT